MYKLNILLYLYCFATIIVFAAQKNICTFHQHDLKEFSYNLTSLSDPAKDIILNYDYLDETIRLQLCQPLKEKCNGKEGYSICLVKNKEEIGIGKMPPKVNTTSGRILFQFTGDDCPMPNTKYTVNILMKCNYKAGNNSLPFLFHQTLEKCNLYFLWETALACSPPVTQNCTVIDNGLHYDLSPLTRYSENYNIQMGNKTSPKIILNVCHSVIFEYKALCQMRSGACMYDPSSKGTRYANLGDIQKPPFIENGKLKLEYQQGDICKLNNQVPDIKTTITFICDFEAIDTVPEYIGGGEECHYQIVWKTAAACSIESLHNHSTISAGKCTVNNPLTNFTYDLRHLMNKDFVTEWNATKFKFGVCSSPKDMACVSGTGICSEKTGTSMGKVNTALMWQEGGPYLNYTNGDLCENGQQSYTIIAFICGAEGSSDKPIVMQQNPCQLIIHWNVDLVCEKRLKCATDDDEINLSSLIKSTNNYIVKVNKTEFHINVCRPLVLLPDLMCVHGSAACKASLTSSNEYVDEISLGFPKEDPILDNNRQTVLRYVDGSPCPGNPQKLISSNFTFPCHDINMGPEFKKYEDCTYTFEWKTSLTCGAATGNWISPCTIREQLFSHECNLSLLHKNQKVYYVKNKQGKVYSISICDGQKICDGSAICQGNNHYGSLANVIFDYSRDVIKIKYTNGSKCEKSSYTSDVQFICNESMGVGTPKLLWESECSAGFEWHTNVTCSCQNFQQTQSSVLPRAYESVEDFSSGHAGTVAGVLLTVIVIAAALLYFRDPNKRARLSSYFSSLSSRRGNSSVQYCRVNTTEVARLLLDVDPTQCPSDSDDDLLNA